MAMAPISTVATRRETTWHRYPSLKRRAKISRRYAAKSAEAIFQKCPNIRGGLVARADEYLKKMRAVWK
jgi:hypothetical protein